MATLTLRLSDGVNPAVVVEDGSSEDLDITPGSVAYVGVIGNFSLTINTGAENLSGGTLQAPELEISSIDVTDIAGQSGTLIVELSNSGFGDTIQPRFYSEVSGVTQGTVVFSTYVSPENELFAGSNLSTLPLGGDETVVFPTLDAPYALTLKAVVTHTDVGDTSFTARFKTTECPPPVVDVNDGTICVGGKVTLSATEVAGATYLWTPGNFTTREIEVSPTDTTTYTVLVTSSQGCTAEASGTVTVYQPPTVVVEDETICLGQDVMLAATVTGDVVSYLWSPGGSTTPSITVSPNADTVYTVTVTGPEGACSATDSATVTVKTPPTVVVTDAEICVGEQVTLSANVTGEVSEYVWSPGGETTPSITVSPGADTVYTVMVTGVSGVCSASDSATVKVTPKPIVTVNSGTICVGESFTLTATASPANVTYLWSNGAITPSITVTPSQTETYTVTVKTTGGCTATASGTITVTPGICEPSEIALDNGGSGGSYSKTFSGPGGVTVQVSAFSRDSNGNWAPASITQYAGSGLGVIDSSGSDSSSPHHAVDNVGRKNYLLFRFSQPVVASGAYLGWVSGDSDFSVRIGNMAGSTLDDSVLQGFYSEENDTASSTARSATFNGGGQLGNALVIAASLTDASPDDFFKLKKITICVPVCQPPPPPCVETTFDFTGNTSTDGSNGNVRTYTANGISVKAYAFSRVRSTGAWYPSYLGAYSGGLGVTDSSEGSGAYNSHTVDNIDRDNFVLFTFSQPVVVNKAYLGYVADDSDLFAAVGNVAGAHSSAQTLSDSYLGGFNLEQNTTTSGGSRWATINDESIAGNVLLLGADPYDSHRNDEFKIEKMVICSPNVQQPPEWAKLGNYVWHDKNANGIQESGEPGVDGVKVELLRCSDNTMVATEVTSGTGYYLFTTTPGEYKLRFSDLPEGFVFTAANAGNDASDSDANAATGLTDCTTLTANEDDRTWDAGINKPQPPPTNEECIPATLEFTGWSDGDGSDGNIRTFNGAGVSVRVSAFSRTTHGSWAPAFLGAYSGGLGVTDSSEGDGSNNRHTVDNLDRNNYILFEFSQPVVVNRAFLGYVAGDSDISVRIGTFTDPYNNHLTLNDSTFAAFGYAESNDTGNSGARWAQFNGGEVIGNAVIIAASLSDTTPDDKFKVEKLGICAVPSAAQCPSPWNTKDIGYVACEGKATYDSTTKKYTIKGSGEDIWGTTDEFRYVYQQASGDCMIVARVVSQESTDPWAKAGVMIRETLNANSKHASIFMTPGNGAAFQHRSSTGDSSGNVNAGGVTNPHWVAIIRNGSTFTAYASEDAQNWTPVGSKTISMGWSVYIGLAVTSHSDGALSSAVFSNVGATP